MSGKKITLGLTGGIACYKVPILVRRLVEAGVDVQVVMTAAAEKFITPLTMETVSGHPVETNLFPTGQFVATRHIDLAQQCDLLVVAPATANFIGKAANGIADDLLTTVFSACDRPVLLAPAMNPVMWNNPITQANVDKLGELGINFVGPESGAMACESSGVGRMAEPEQILDAVAALLTARKKKALKGRRVVVTAGPCREAIDPVRYISNHSSGKMGYAIAEAASELGAETILISGPTDLPGPGGVRIARVESTAQMLAAVEAEFDRADVQIMAAAPADFRPKTARSSKIKKAIAAMTVELEPTEDILKTVAARKRPGQLLVGFALETDDALANARQKLKDKNLDLIVLNRVGRETGPGGDTNQVTIVRPRRKPDEWPLASKREVAESLLSLIADLL